MEHRLLRAFVAVAEELHFGRAARRLHLSQPPLSMQIRRLESDLGTRLFERDRRGVVLTPPGEALLGRARHLLAEAARAKTEVARIASGVAGAFPLAYTAAATHRLLPRMVPLMRARMPDVRLELTEIRSVDQADAIREGRIELGLVCAPVDALDLVLHPLTEERLMVALPQQHPLARRSVVRVSELDGEPYVGVRPDVEPGWALAALRSVHAAGVRLDVVQETDTKIAMLGLVAARVGLSIVGESMRALGRQGVVYRPLRGVDLRLVLAALAPHEPTPRAKNFLALARERRR
ncbi:MAG TPA: LysR substrate-binding domain-containing protein [Polyangia bacterium]|nr:LysR substrate-binding domain-containing protein [Polyangia bacterium]